MASDASDASDLQLEYSRQAEPPDPLSKRVERPAGRISFSEASSNSSLASASAALLPVNPSLPSSTPALDINFPGTQASDSFSRPNAGAFPSAAAGIHSGSVVTNSSHSQTVDSSSSPFSFVSGLFSKLRSARSSSSSATHTARMSHRQYPHIASFPGESPLDPAPPRDRHAAARNSDLELDLDGPLDTADSPPRPRDRKLALSDQAAPSEGALQDVYRHMNTDGRPSDDRERKGSSRSRKSPNDDGDTDSLGELGPDRGALEDARGGGRRKKRPVKEIADVVLAMHTADHPGPHPDPEPEEDLQEAFAPSKRDSLTLEGAQWTGVSQRKVRAGMRCLDA